MYRNCSEDEAFPEVCCSMGEDGTSTTGREGQSTRGKAAGAPCCSFQLPLSASGRLGSTSMGSLNSPVSWHDLQKRQVLRNFIFPSALGFQVGSNPSAKLQNHFHFIFWMTIFLKEKTVKASYGCHKLLLVSRSSFHRRNRPK